MGDWFPEQAESDLTCLVYQKSGDRMIKQFLNSVIAKYHYLAVPSATIDLLATDKSGYFAQPHPVIVNYLLRAFNVD